MHADEGTTTAGASIFLPFYYSLIAMIIMILYLIYTKQLKSVIQNTPKGYVAILFGLYSLIVCLCTQNLLGTAQTLGMIAIAIFIMYYRKHVDERLFTFIVDTCCLLSILCFIYGLLEYVTIVERSFLVSGPTKKIDVSLCGFFLFAARFACPHETVIDLPQEGEGVWEIGNIFYCLFVIGGMCTFLWTLFDFV